MSTFTREQNQNNSHLNGHTVDANARQYIESLLAGTKPEKPDVGRYAVPIGFLDEEFDKNPGSVARVLHSLIECKIYPGLAELFIVSARQQDANARQYIEALLSGHKPDIKPDVGRYAEPIGFLDEEFDRNPANVQNVLRALIKSKQYPKLAQLFNGSPAPEQGSASTSYTTKKTEINDEATFPALPEAARTPKDFKLTSSEAYQLLCTYVEFSKKASPEAYEDFHIFCGLWLLSVVAARRVYIWLQREKVYTNLMLVLCAESTAYAKSFTAKVAISCAIEAGFDHLLVKSKKITPEKLMSNMAGKWLPTDYTSLPEDKRKLVDKRIAMAGQKGVYWDEEGKFLKSMIKENSPMANFQDLLLQLNDCTTNGNDTVGRGDETIEKPYLATLGSLVPSTLKSIARAGAVLWQDGFFPRCNFICAPETGSIDKCVESGYLEAPQKLIKALQEWNSALGEAKVMIDADIDPKDKKGKPTITIVKELPEYPCILEPEADAARIAYRSALKKFCNQKGLSQHESIPADLKPGYIRLAETALRIAMLLASLENRNSHVQKTIITLTHWRVAQELTELLRKNLHRFYAQVNGHKSHASRIEDDIMEVIKRLTKKAKEEKKTEWFTPNDLRRYLKGRLSTKEIEDVLKSLKNAVLEWAQSSHATAGLYRLREAETEENNQE